MKWQFPRNCANQVTTGLRLSPFAARDFAFAGDRRASIDERLHIEVRSLGSPPYVSGRSMTKVFEVVLSGQYTSLPRIIVSLFSAESIPERFLPS
jgi:hypothetical protein